MKNKEITSLEPTAPIKDLLEILDRDGCAIINNLATRETIGRIEIELGSDIENTVPGNGDFVGYKTKRTHTVLANSITAGLLALQPMIMAVTEKVLGPYCNKFQLSSSVVISLGPGEERQELHRDDLVYPFKHPITQQSVITVIWALDEFTEDNGATLVVPGSHCWDDERKPNFKDTVPAVMSRGSVVILLGSLYHAGGTNQTNATRTGLLYGYCLGWLRQEQNQYLAVPPSVAKNLPEDLQKLIGYTVHEPFLGWHDLQDPIVVLQGYKDSSRGAQDLTIEGQVDAAQKSDVRRT